MSIEGTASRSAPAALRSRLQARIGMRSLGWLGLSALVVALPFALRGSFYLHLVDSAAIYALAVVGTIVLFSAIGQLSFVSAGLFGVGAFTAAFLSTEWHWDFVLAIVGAAIVTPIIGAIIATPFLRLRGLYLSIGTLAFVLLMQELYTQWGLQRHDVGFVVTPQIAGNPIAGDVSFYWLAIIPLLLLTGFVNQLLRGPTGRAFRAIRDSEIAAAASGIRVAAATVGASCLAAVTAGVAGAVYAGFVGYVEPDMFGLGLVLLLTTMAVVGGARPLLGATVGSLLLTLLPHWLQGVRGFSADVQQGVYGALLIVILLFLPGGVSSAVELARAAATRLARPRTAGPQSATAVRFGEAAARPAKRVSQRRDPISARGLTVSGVTVAFGGNVAVRDVSLEVAPREILGLIGPNGAGKSTLLNCISGIQRPDSGAISVGGVDLSKLGVAARARLGISRTFQSGQLLKGQTVLENVLIGTHARSRSSDRRGFSARQLTAKATEGLREECLASLEELGIIEYAHRPVGSVPMGVQRLTDLARALASDPWLLLLDEPGAGLSERDCGFLAELIGELRQQTGLSVVLVEHNLPFVMKVCDRLIVLDFGVTIAQGGPDEIRRNPQVVAAYLGPSASDGTRIDG